jgi:hypothetical protein
MIRVHRVGETHTLHTDNLHTDMHWPCRVACKVAQKGDFPRFRVVNELCGPAEKLLKAFEQPGSTVSPKDVANVVRLLAVLNLVTSGDFKNVEVSFLTVSLPWLPNSQCGSKP